MTDGDNMDDLGDLDNFARAMRDPNLQLTDLDGEQIENVVVIIHRMFCHVSSTCIGIQHARLEVLFGPHTEVDIRYRGYIKTIMKIGHLVEVAEDMSEEKQKEMNTLIGQASSNLLYGRETMICLYQQQFVTQQSIVLPKSTINAHLTGSLKDDEEGLKPHQQLIRYYLNRCSLRRYRKIPGETALFRPKFINDQFTHYFEHDMDIDEFIHDAIYPYAHNVKLFSWLTERGSTHGQVRDHLKNCVDDELPPLKKRRTLFAYQNGLYDALKDMFYPYVPDNNWRENGKVLVADDLGEDVACNYLDYNFDYRSIYNHDDPYDIPTPSCQEIMDCQEFEPEVCRWLYACIGRLIFEVGYDGWQFFLFCKGVAGSGKSTLLNLAAQFYTPMDVGTLMSETNKTFTLEHLYNKYVFFCVEVSSQMTMAVARFNQIVEGSRLSVERKFKVPLDVFWKVTGAFAGNEFPPWVDKGGNISRRMMVFLFEKMVKVIDPTLYGRCKGEMPSFMRKCVACYHDLKKRHGHRGIWEKGVLPEFFHRTKKKMQAESNSLQSILQDEDVCVLEEGAICTFAKFKDTFMSYCIRNSLSKPKVLSNDYMANVLRDHNVTFCRPQGGNPADHHGQTKNYLLGVRLRSDDDNTTTFL